MFDDSPFGADRLVIRPFFQREKPLFVPMSSEPSAASRTLQTTSAGRPSDRLMVTNLPGRSWSTPPEAVPTQRLPSRSSYSEAIEGLERPCSSLSAANFPFE